VSGDPTLVFAYSTDSSRLAALHQDRATGGNTMTTAHDQPAVSDFIGHVLNGDRGLVQVWHAPTPQYKEATWLVRGERHSKAFGALDRYFAARYIPGTDPSEYPVVGLPNLAPLVRSDYFGLRAAATIASSRRSDVWAKQVQSAHPYYGLQTGPETIRGGLA
jgi:hypothetical protein